MAVLEEDCDGLFQESLLSLDETTGQSSEQHVACTNHYCGHCQNFKVNPDMSSSQKLVKKCNGLTNTYPFGRYEPSAVTDKLGERLERKLKTLELGEKYGIIRSSSAHYKIVDFLGEGTFGQVVKCLEQRTRKSVAVKIPTMSFSARRYMNERNILQRLNEDNPEKFHIIRLLDSFSFNCKGILVYELLERSLKDFLSGPLPLPSTLNIMYQVLSALGKMKELRIVHTDIKPQNIALVNNSKRPLYVKLIDFGSAIQLPVMRLPESVQPLTYRAPEVMLGLPYDEGIDMWSAGCLLAELLLGSVLYPGHMEYHNMRFICDTHNIPPAHMLNCGKRVKRYFCRLKFPGNDASAAEKVWRLKTADEYEIETGRKFIDSRDYAIRSLSDILEMNVAIVEDEDMILEAAARKDHCEDLLRMMLAIDPKDRISPESALSSGIFDHIRDLPDDFKRS